MTLAPACTTALRYDVTVLRVLPEAGRFRCFKVGNAEFRIMTGTREQVNKHAINTGYIFGLNYDLNHMAYLLVPSASLTN